MSALEESYEEFWAKRDPVKKAGLALVVSVLALCLLTAVGCGTGTGKSKKNPQSANGATWTNTAGGVSSYSIHSLAYDSGHKLLYAGCSESSDLGQGVWKYDGTAWANTAGGVSDYIIDSLAYDSGHNLLYAGTWDHGVWSR